MSWAFTTNAHAWFISTTVPLVTLSLVVCSVTTLTGWDGCRWEHVRHDGSGRVLDAARASTTKAHTTVWTSHSRPNTWFKSAIVPRVTLCLGVCRVSTLVFWWEHRRHDNSAGWDGCRWDHIGHDGSSIVLDAERV